MRAALRHLRERAGEGRAIAVLGGMAELGDTASAYHREIAELARRARGRGCIAVGELGRLYGADGLGRRTRTPPSTGSATLVRPGDTVLVKASRSVGLEASLLHWRTLRRAWSES